MSDEKKQEILDKMKEGEAANSTPNPEEGPQVEAESLEAEPAS